MKKIISTIAVSALLTACQAAPQETPTLPTDDSTQVFSEYFSFDLPAGWVKEEGQVLDGPIPYSLRSQETMPDGYSCEEDIASVNIAPYLYNDPKVPVDFDEFAVSDGVYSEQGSLGQFGGKAEKTTLNGKPAYHYEDAGIEAPCPGSAYLVNDGDYFFQVIAFSKTGGKAEEDMKALIDSIVW